MILKVRCSVCGKALNGFETPDGKIGVRHHEHPDTGRKCEGRFRRDHQLRGQRQPERTPA